MKIIISLLLLITFSVPGLAQQPDARTLDEINHLLDFIKSSQCDFNRNGTWYKASEAADHINTKYEYVLGKGFVGSSDDFIKYAATKSSMSGKKYVVRCGDNGIMDSSDWLHKELAAFRSLPN